MAQVAAPGAPAVESPAGPEAAPAVTLPIPLEEVPDRAVATSAELGVLKAGAASRRLLERFGSEIELSLPTLVSNTAAARDALVAESEVRKLQENVAVLRDLRESIRPWENGLDEQLALHRSALQRLDEIAAVWQETGELARREDSDATIVARITAVQSEIETTRPQLIELRNQTLALRDRLVDPSEALMTVLEQLDGAIGERRRGIFRADLPALWSPEVRAALAEERKAVGPESISERLAEGRLYVSEQWRRLGVQIALFLALGLGLRLLRDRARHRAEDDYDLQDALDVFDRPWAMALLITVLFSAPLHPLAPRGTDLVSGVFLAGALLRIGWRLLGPVFAPLTWALMAIFVLERVRVALGDAPTLERIVFLAELVGALGFLLWIRRPSRLAAIPPELRQEPFLPLLGGTVQVACVVLALAIVADLGGLGDLAILLGSGALRSGTLGFFVFVCLAVVQSLATFALVLWPLRRLRSISRHRVLIRRRLDLVLSVVAVGVWGALVLGRVGLLDLVRDGAGRVLAAGISTGSFSLTVGDVLAFALTLWGSLLIARLLVFVLQEDVFTRVSAARGVPYAISGLVRYSLIVLGFLVGLSAMGVELTKLTVVAGGLGVGIGFGLQGVVNNFVSGLILLFERPIQVGDTVALPDCWGSMKHIGIRASVIHTFDGAEVIVPNGMLISEKVTNWTLSDRRRRVELDVGVRYGTPARRVIEVLLAVAAANPKVIAVPEPRAYFVAFGDSALNFKLRVWSELFDDGYAIRSELAVAVQDAFEAEGIGVPFPQRDLHLVSVSPGVASDLDRMPRSSPLPVETPDADDH